MRNKLAKIYVCEPEGVEPPFPRHFITDIHKCSEAKTVDLEELEKIIGREEARRLVEEGRLVIVDEEKALKLTGKSLDNGYLLIILCSWL
ncbi:hypothetical protein ACSU1N_06510 [Thermogladius sp. 4427co]|uniref:hypothetical protein n=1 Tax=Thermogladius sp. 4427co TaxID=3450718 RepID=UPI003F7AEAD6